ncbi:MAG TPA: hypothetical protein VJM09_09910 [Sphingobium sp.]|nr:hypothetical protein [Sphingobium sp.]
MNSVASGRPVRFFVILMGGWTAIRLISVASGMLDISSPAALPPSSSPQKLALAKYFTPAIAAQATLKATETGKPALAAAKGENAPRTAPRLLAHALMAPISRAPASPTKPARRATATTAAPPAYASAPESGSRPPASLPVPTAIPVAPPAQDAQPTSNRWRGSIWALWRDGSATSANAATAGRLGGSQVGLRLDYDLTPHAPGRTAAYGRVSSALDRPASPEAALGIAWQPVRAIPISLAAERRIALGKGARDANTLLVVGGFGPTPVTRGLEAEAYAQAGMVGFRNKDLFADGKFSLMAPLAHSPLRLGASVSGGAQPRVERLDIGPELQVRLPLPRVATRLSVEWRERIAGRAAPNSGLAVTLGADF